MDISSLVGGIEVQETVLKIGKPGLLIILLAIRQKAKQRLYQAVPLCTNLTCFQRVNGTACLF